MEKEMKQEEEEGEEKDKYRLESNCNSRVLEFYSHVLERQIREKKKRIDDNTTLVIRHAVKTTCQVICVTVAPRTARSNNYNFQVCLFFPCYTLIILNDMMYCTS